ncbi:MAG: hypothetical protein P8N76_23995 [Pirellulaceae bacterium]|nr:hypothetical protein [Pirellulaceae bacterium]
MWYRRLLLFASIPTLVLGVALSVPAETSSDSKLKTQITITLDRGKDLGQCFGSLFEATSENGSLTIGAGFQNAYNTRYRADRHALHFFVRPRANSRQLTVEELPRPTKNLTGAYLFHRDGTVYSTEGGLKSWNAVASQWTSVNALGGTHESMRVGNGTLTFGDSKVLWNGHTILSPPENGRYQLFFYAHGHLCFYHVNRQNKPYRIYQNDQDGSSRLFACPWTPEESNVDLSRAIVLQLPIVGETTFAWGQLNRQIVTGSNIGGFYVFENGKWRMILKPRLSESYQLYSTLGFDNRLVMGQYPTGRVFAYDGKQITDQPGWPPVLAGVSAQAREAQTTTIYGGELFVGVWPWGELWRYNPSGRKWGFLRRMFTHPKRNAQIIHPYDIENASNTPQNLWGQRVTSLITNGPNLFVSTSAKAPHEWKPDQYPFLTADQWKSYGKVYRATMPGHLSVPTQWTHGATQFEFIINHRSISIRQDGHLLGKSVLSSDLATQIKQVVQYQRVKWGSGTYGPFGGISLKGELMRE